MLETILSLGIMAVIMHTGENKPFDVKEAAIFIAFIIGFYWYVAAHRERYQKFLLWLEINREVEPPPLRLNLLKGVGELFKAVGVLYLFIFVVLKDMILSILKLVFQSRSFRPSSKRRTFLR